MGKPEEKRGAKEEYTIITKRKNKRNSRRRKRVPRRIGAKETLMSEGLKE